MEDSPHSPEEAEHEQAIAQRKGAVEGCNCEQHPNHADAGIDGIHDGCCHAFANLHDLRRCQLAVQQGALGCSCMPAVRPVGALQGSTSSTMLCPAAA